MNHTMMMRYYDACTSGLQTLFSIVGTKHTLRNKRHTRSLDKLSQFFCRLCLHRKSEYIVVATLGIESMVDIHTHGYTASLDGMFNFTQHLTVVGMWFDDLDGSGACCNYFLKFLVAAHTNPMYSSTLNSRLGIDCHAVLSRIVQMRQGCRHNRCTEGFAKQRHLGGRKD